MLQLEGDVEHRRRCREIKSVIFIQMCFFITGSRRFNRRALRLKSSIHPKINVNQTENYNPKPKRCTGYSYHTATTRSRMLLTQLHWSDKFNATGEAQKNALSSCLRQAWQATRKDLISKLNIFRGRYMHYCRLFIFQSCAHMRHSHMCTNIIVIIIAMKI